MGGEAYSQIMDVGVTALRADLSTWIERARDGEEIVVTDRGVPVVRMVAVDSMTAIETLTAQGVIRPPARPDRPRAGVEARIRARGSVSDLVDEHRG